MKLAFKLSDKTKMKGNLAYCVINEGKENETLCTAYKSNIWKKVLCFFFMVSVLVLSY